ncbi:dnaJ homolog subfamily B member 14-like [Gigantopelta aegis]|uniref:dnaJ homolog subfamily B member 14-like n=1 Tax=Gigantopelta aegis TaxID=1735272 RepID=UPI001B888122|nr:dnaJ homolog subfamily B member 14-like [Gigantopelta aegis]
MEGNKDESGRCILIARKCINIGAVEKAVRFLQKAERLYPTQEAKDLLSELQGKDASSNNTSSSSRGTKDSETKDPDGMRKRKGSFSREFKNSNKENEPDNFTDEQVNQVKRILKCKDFYAILCVSKEATEIELKKAYRKLALQMHPDKNKAPGATEAFKAVGTAFAVLSDSSKRKRYDTYGPEMEAPSRRMNRDHDYSHGFEGDISPEELFNMFFGGGFPSNGTTRYHQRTHQTHHFSRDSQPESGYTLFLQLTPILLLVLLSLLSSMFVSDPIFSLQRTSKYSVERKTYNLKIPYYVKEDFRPEYKGELRRIDRMVEEEYTSNLRANCWRERSYKENMLWKARNYGDAKLYQRAQDLGTPSCDQLHRMYS